MRFLSLLAATILATSGALAYYDDEYTGAVTARDLFDDDLVQERYFDDIEEYDAREFLDEEAYDARDFEDDEFEAREFDEDEYEARDYDDEEDLMARVINPALLGGGGARRTTPGGSATRLNGISGGKKPAPGISRLRIGQDRRTPSAADGRKPGPGIRRLGQDRRIAPGSGPRAGGRKPGHGIRRPSLGQGRASRDSVGSSASRGKGRAKILNVQSPAAAKGDSVSARELLEDLLDARDKADDLAAKRKRRRQRLRKLRKGRKGGKKNKKLQAAALKTQGPAAPADASAQSASAGAPDAAAPPAAAAAA